MPVSIFWTIVLVICGALFIIAFIGIIRDDRRLDAQERDEKDRQRRDPGTDK